MPEHWYRIGTEWVTLHSGLAHGDVVRETTEFAARNKLTANTIRGYRAAVLFVNRLRDNGTIDEAQHKVLIRQKIKSIAVLQRVDHRGSGHLAPFLAKVLSEEPPSRKELEVDEAKLREIEARAAARRALRGETPIEANAHSFTLRAKVFRVDGVEAWRKLHGLEELPAPDPGFAEGITPLTVDRVTSSADGMHALRLIAETSREPIPETSEKSKVSPRLGEAFAGALAAARVFRSVLLLAQSNGDAETLGLLARRFRGCGVLVAWLSPDGTIMPTVKAERVHGPDLERLLPVTLEPKAVVQSPAKEP